MDHTQTEQKNIQVIKDMYAAFGRGDMPFIMDRIALEGFERWAVVAGGTWRAPWHQPATSKQEVAKYFEAVLGTLEPLRLEPTHYAATGNQVYATVHMEYKVRASGRILVMDVVHRFKLLDGRVVGVSIYEDTQYTREALAESRH